MPEFAFDILHILERLVKKFCVDFRYNVKEPVNFIFADFTVINTLPRRITNLAD